MYIATYSILYVFEPCIKYIKVYSSISSCVSESEPMNFLFVLPFLLWEIVEREVMMSVCGVALYHVP